MDKVSQNALNILHVDDSSDHQLIMKSALLKTGIVHHLTQCSSRDEVIELIESKCSNDLVFLDYHLGDTTSEDMLSWFEGVPIIVVTAREDDELDSHLMKLGAADFLSKAELSANLLKRVIRHALERQCILNQFIKESMHDALTGLHNRRFVMRELVQLSSLARRYGHEFCLSLIDMDGLKPINDMHGHLVGDAAIKYVADSIRQAVREGDVVARIGGDEFLVIFRNASCVEAEKALHRLIDQLRDSPLQVSDMTLNVSVSCGLVSSCLEPHDALLARADELLYQAKNAGKGRIFTQ